MAGEFAGKATFVKVDLTNDEDPQTAALKYEVSAIPATLIFKDGELMGSVIGADESAIKAEVEKVL